MTISQEQLDAAVAKARKEAEDAAAANFAASQAELTRLQGERQAERIGALITGWTAGGKITPAQTEGLAEFMTSIEGGAGEFTFSAADKSEVKKAPAQFFAEFMDKLKPVVKLGNQSDAGVNQETVDPTDASQIADRAKSYMKEQADKGMTVSLPEAVAFVSRTA